MPIRAMLIYATASFCILPLISKSTYSQQADATLDQLLDDSWAFRLKESPTFATRVGEHRYNALLADESLENQARRNQAQKEFLNRLEAIDRSQLSRAAQINYDVYERLLRDRIAEYDFQMHLIPITNREGFHVFFPELPRQVPLQTVADYDNYVARLKQFERYAQDHIELMRKGIDERFVLPAVVLEGFRGQLEPHIVEDPTKSLLYSPFTAFPDRISDSEKERISEEGQKAIQDGVVAGYRTLLEFMEAEYVPSCRGSIGASALPDGRAFYRHRVRRFTTLDITPEQVHETGMREVERIRKEMHEIIRRVEFDGDLAAFLKFLRTDPQFYATTPDQLMKETAYVLKVMDGKLPALFKKMPRTPYGIREIPSYIAPKTTSAYYQQPAGDGSRAGYYFVNTYNLKARPLYGVEALSLHEAVPGHHLQIALQQELTDIPQFRRFAGITAFVEGWALYAERLGLEVGFYKDPYSDFGRLTYEMWRACRLVVDTGIHYLGWTRQQAIDFMANNTALSIHNVEAEVDRYISWPGQALAYKTGELKIRELRQRAEQTLGDRFDIREFHDVVLGSGAVPLTVLESNVEQYIGATE